MGTAYSELPNELVSAANGIDYAYRDTGGGDGAVPLVLLQHFRGNLDNWDPALVDALAARRRVVTPPHHRTQTDSSPHQGIGSHGAA